MEGKLIVVNILAACLIAFLAFKLFQWLIEGIEID